MEDAFRAVQVPPALLLAAPGSLIPPWWVFPAMASALVLAVLANPSPTPDEPVGPVMEEVRSWHADDRLFAE